MLNIPPQLKLQEEEEYDDDDDGGGGGDDSDDSPQDRIQSCALGGSLELLVCLIGSEL